MSFCLMPLCSVSKIISGHLNPFHVTGLFLYPLKTPENPWFFEVFKGFSKRPKAKHAFFMALYGGSLEVFIFFEILLYRKK